MFSDNDKVSARQIKYLLILEWTAKLCLLLPIVLSGRSAGSMIFCMIFGSAIWSGFIWITVRWLDPEKSFFSQLCAAAGKPAAFVVLAAGLLYFLVQAAVFTNLCAEVTALYLLPEVPVPLLCVLPIAAGVYLAYGSVEIRGRFCEVTGPVVLGLVILLVIAAAFGSLSIWEEDVWQNSAWKVAGPIAVELSGRERMRVSVNDRLMSGGLEVFACMGGMFVPLYSGHFINGMPNNRAKRNKKPDGESGNGKENRKEHTKEDTKEDTKENGVCCDIYRAVRTAGHISAVISGSLCALAVLSYGKNGMQAMDFPTIRVMSNMQIPDAFWQRWDIPFLALLMVSMTVTVSGSMWYVREIMEVFETERRAWMRRREAACVLGYERTAAENSMRWKAGDASGKQVQSDEKKAEAAIQKSVYVLWFACAVFVYFAAAGFLNAFTAVCYYRAMNMQILLPLIFFFYIIMGIYKTIMGIYRSAGSAERKGRYDRKIKTAKHWKNRTAGRLSGILVLAVIVLTAVFFITGCSARDPEERLYSLALEIGMEDGKLALTYAWSEGLGPAMSQVNQSGTMHTGPISSSKNLTTIKGSSLAEIQKLETEFSERQLDYSHVKAIILRDNLQAAPEIQREVMEWLAGDPALASGLLVYRSSDQAPGLKEAEEHSSGQIGAYLENLYKNSEKYRAMATSLGEVIAEYYAESGAPL